MDTSADRLEILELLSRHQIAIDDGFTEEKRHLTGPAQIEIDGDEARALSCWWVTETKYPPGADGDSG